MVDDPASKRSETAPSPAEAEHLSDVAEAVTPTEAVEADPDEVADGIEPPFTAKTFGGAFVWAKAPGYVATVLRIREGQDVAVSTQHRRDMVVMLTGGRGIMEIGDGGRDVDRVELLPATPMAIAVGPTYRLLAMTEVELFTIYTPL